MTQPRDLRELLNPLRTIRASRTKTTHIPQTTAPPPDLPDWSDVEPIVVPERTVIAPLPQELPPELLTPDGQPDTVKMVGLLWGALGQVQDQQIRTVVGRATVTSGNHPAGATWEVPITWDETPLEVPTGGVVQIYAAIVWLGKTTAQILPGSITDAGCTVVARALGPVVPTAANPITFEAQGIYLHTPPYTPPAA